MARDEQRLRRLFTQALQLPEGEREAFLERVCDDRELRRRTLDLLARTAEVESRTPGDATAPETLSEQDPSHPVIPPFEIERELGRGGMGIVYLARDPDLDRLVAIKVLHPHFAFSETALARFRHEGRIMAKLEHQSILGILGVGEHDRLHYIVSKYVCGKTLSEHALSLRETRGDPEILAEVATLIAAVAEALEYAHQHGVIHRDVKPSNIIVAADGKPLLADFGLAKYAEFESLTTEGQLAGTPSYMSPEQVLAKRVVIDHRTDIYSLGVVLYELLARRTPFEGSSAEEILRAISFDVPRDVRAHNPSVPKNLATICHKAMEKNPEDRYQAAGQLAADLRCFVAGRPILARPPSLWRLARGWASRNKVGALSASTVLLALLVVGVSLVAIRHIRADTTPVSVTSGTPMEVQVRRIDERTLELGPAMVEGSTPYRDRLRPGQYRIIASGADGSREIDFLVVRGAPPIDLSVGSLPSGSPIEDDMILVPAGDYPFGRPGSEGFEAARTVHVGAFYIDRFETTNAEFKAFVDSTGREAPYHWQRWGYPETLADHPVSGVTWDEAQAYARWAGKRLPSVFEWEAAARGPEGRVLPWGEGLPDGYVEPTGRMVQRVTASVWEWGLEEYAAHTRRVDGDADYATPSGIHHLHSNVSELTGSVAFWQGDAVLVKGANWTEHPELWDVTRNGSRPRTSRSIVTGFRCAMSADLARE